jgi:hypothetical protein
MGKTPKRLALSRETVRELSNPELGDVAGGDRQSSQLIPCIYLQHTVIPSCNCTGYYPSFNAVCTGGAC